MVKSFQKPAKRLQELQLPHPGILDLEGFNKYFQLHCYKPSPDLEPFLVHVWTQRWKRPEAAQYQPVEVLSGPNTYLFFTAKTAFIHGIVAHELRYDAHTPGVIAGVKFKPGGFYPFWKRPMVELTGKTPPVEPVFPEANRAFTNKLLAQTDEGIFDMLETLLRNKHLAPDKNVDLVNEIMAALDNDEALQTVGAMAQAFGKSERSLQLLFQIYVGVGLKWVITRKRLLATVRQVHDRGRPTWVEAAAELGYSSQSHFARDFKRIIGLSPSQYLKSTVPASSSLADV
jgi:AraC-like DNA-binding protein